MNREESTTKANEYKRNKFNLQIILCGQAKSIHNQYLHFLQLNLTFHSSFCDSSNYHESIFVAECFSLFIFYLWFELYTQCIWLISIDIFCAHLSHISYFFHCFAIVINVTNNSFFFDIFFFLLSFSLEFASLITNVKKFLLVNMNSNDNNSRKKICGKLTSKLMFYYYRWILLSKFHFVQYQFVNPSQCYQHFSTRTLFFSVSLLNHL